MFTKRRFTSATKSYEQELVRLGLLPSDGVKASRYRQLGLVFAALWTVAVIKILLALSRGRTNIAILIAEAILFAFAAWKMGNPRLTARGKALLGDLRMLFGSLRARAPSMAPSTSSNELALMAAVFGLAAIPASAFPYVKRPYPRAAAGRSSCGSTLGSGYGPACGSSCGSSCGGGGCGGGCGGCGS